MTGEEKDLDDVYHDRNLLALAFATAVGQMFGPGFAGWYLHDGWPVIWAKIETGQVSWHVTPDLCDVIERSYLQEGEPEPEFDGHSRTEKNSRLARYITGQYPTRPTRR